MSTYTISPSDLTFSWDGCKRCFYLKVKHNIAYRGPFPGMFGIMGNLTSNFYLDKPSSEISPGLPPGKVTLREKWVKSAPISFPDIPSQCTIRGRFDAIITFEDGSYGIIDYKTSDASEEKATFYSRQLSAYAYALENPAAGALSLAPITRLGLFIITPERFEKIAGGETGFVTRTTWMDIPHDDATFLALLREIVTLAGPAHPPNSCRGLRIVQLQKGLSRGRNFQSDFPQPGVEAESIFRMKCGSYFSINFSVRPVEKKYRPQDKLQQENHSRREAPVDCVRLPDEHAAPDIEPHCERQSKKGDQHQQPIHCKGEDNLPPGFYNIDLPAPVRQIVKEGPEQQPCYGHEAHIPR